MMVVVLMTMVSVVMVSVSVGVGVVVGLGMEWGAPEVDEGAEGFPIGFGGAEVGVGAGGRHFGGCVCMFVRLYDV
ncbi:hypothetical protein B0J18DRAFT_440801 [Chaetomium sp. MPI-SDFR-AT-0129]|nr:hypothetical protein B0J18DRAFT_440801 [Chaetomium sp. MPI-SDFR-AT-0129]